MGETRNETVTECLCFMYCLYSGCTLGVHVMKLLLNGLKVRTLCVARCGNELTPTMYQVG